MYFATADNSASARTPLIVPDPIFPAISPVKITARLFRFAPAMALAMLLLAVWPTHAVPIVSGDILFSPDADLMHVDPTKGWKITFNSATITSVDWAPNAAWGSSGTKIMGTLTVKEEFKDFNSVVFTFEDTEPAADEFGLRFLLVKEVKNSTTAAWSRFENILADMDPGDPGNPGDKDHPTAFHAHSPSILAKGANGLNDIRITSGINLYDNSYGALNNIILSGGELGIGETEKFQFGPHDWRVMNVNRKGTLTETPFAVPEPVTFALMLVGLGGLALFGGRWRRGWQTGGARSPLPFGSDSNGTYLN